MADAGTVTPHHWRRRLAALALELAGAAAWIGRAAECGVCGAPRTGARDAFEARGN